MKLNISFKKNKPATGLASVGAGKPNIAIKLNKKKIGWIETPTWTTQTANG